MTSLQGHRRRIAARAHGASAAQFNAWLASTLNQSQSATGDEDTASSSAIGDTDRIMASASDINGADEKSRQKTVERLQEILGTKVHLEAVIGQGN